MTINQVDRTTTTEEAATTGTSADAPPSGERTAVRSESTRTTTSLPGGNEMTRRIIVLLFGLIQVAIALRFVLLLLDAREANGLVSGILNLSQLFVAPFDGILKTNNLQASGSIFDVTAVVAFVGWSILELIVLWAVDIFRREPA